MALKDSVSIECKACGGYWRVDRDFLNELSIKNYFLATAYIKCRGCGEKVPVPLPKPEDL
ncbi:MAG: hypothetical protein EBT03_11710 [Betaproteobacteria bacterium]|nr:hypothetical protein [Betaproteobacteria bacterium]